MRLGRCFFLAIFLAIFLAVGCGDFGVGFETSAGSGVGGLTRVDGLSAVGPYSMDAGPPAGDWIEVCNVSSNLNMRSGPGTSYSVIASLPPGAKALLLDDSSTWWKLEYQGLVGWCHSNYLCPPGSSSGGGPGGNIGTMWNTYYYLANENDYAGSKNTTLYDANCNPLAQVSAAYSDAVCIEGSGKLASGEVINYARTCSCGRRCPTGGTICYKKLSISQFPWGEGAFGNALVPFRSIAVDKSYIPLKTVLYLKEWDGVSLPTVGGIGGFVHDGCFRADDVGGAIKTTHYDFFAGTKQMNHALESIHPTKSTFNAYHGGDHCAYLEVP